MGKRFPSVPQGPKLKRYHERRASSADEMREAQRYYMRKYRADEKHRQETLMYSRVRQKALARLGRMYPADYKRLRDEELENERSKMDET